MIFKTLKFSLLIIATMLLANSCSKDDDDDQPSCAQADWIGSYTASTTCDPDRVEVYDVEITAGTGENDLIFTDSEGDDSNITISGCEIPEFGIFTISFSGSLSGNAITYTITDSDPDDMYSCTVTYTKQ